MFYLSDKHTKGKERTEKEKEKETDKEIETETETNQKDNNIIPKSSRNEEIERFGRLKNKMKCEIKSLENLNLKQIYI